MFKEDLPKKDPLLENFGHKTFPYGQHIPLPSTYCVLPPGLFSHRLSSSVPLQNVGVAVMGTMGTESIGQADCRK